jgi:hypothetical protein
MLEILTLQVIAATLGTASIGAADWLHLRGRIRPALHALWVSGSSTAVCLPVLIWTTDVFLGLGLLSEVLIGMIEMVIFIWMYCNLRKLPTEEQLERGLLTPRPPADRSRRAQTSTIDD